MAAPALLVKVVALVVVTVWPEMVRVGAVMLSTVPVKREPSRSGWSSTLLP